MIPKSKQLWLAKADSSLRKCQVPWTTTKATDLSPVPTRGPMEGLLCVGTPLGLGNSEPLGLSLWRLRRRQLYCYWRKHYPQESRVYSSRPLNGNKKQLKVSCTLLLHFIKNCFIKSCLSRIVIVHPWWKPLSQWALQEYSINILVLEYSKHKLLAPGVTQLCERSLDRVKIVCKNVFAVSGFYNDCT